MTDAKAQARKLKAQIQRHGVITVLIDDEGKAHGLPGYAPQILGTYDARISMANLVEDLEHAGRTP